jgi:hypothetical protein
MADISEEIVNVNVLFYLMQDAHIREVTSVASNKDS